MVQSVYIPSQAVTGTAYLFLYPSSINFEDLKQRKIGIVLYFCYAHCVLWLFMFLATWKKQRLSKSTIYGWRHRKIDYTRLPWIAGSSRTIMWYAIVQPQAKKLLMTDIKSNRLVEALGQIVCQGIPAGTPQFRPFEKRKLLGTLCKYSIQ